VSRLAWFTAGSVATVVVGLSALGTWLALTLYADDRDQDPPASLPEPEDDYGLVQPAEAVRDVAARYISGAIADADQEIPG
jgi:hypothetical protein